MSEIILHIGTHKTGTTTLQNTLFHNRALLKARGLVYPRIGEIAPHHNLVTRWIDLPPQFRTRRTALQDWAIIARAWAGGDETVLVSSEEFSRMQPTAVDFRELGGLIERFDRKRVACVIRNQLGFIQSVYVQVTKNQSFVDFDYFVSQCVRSRQATGLALDYNLLLDHVLTGFEPGEVVLIPYEQSVAGEGLVAAFCRRLGLPVAGAELAPLPAGNSNVSPTPLALWLANQAAAPRPASRALIAMAEDLVVAALGPGARTTLFTRGQVGRVRRTFLTANRRFQGRARAIDPDFAMAPLRLHEDTLYRDDIDAPGLVAALRASAVEGKPFPAFAVPPRPGSVAADAVAAPAVRGVPAPSVVAPRVAPSFEAFRTRPSPIAIASERMVVSWSPKSACSHVVLWTFLHEGLAAEAAAYHDWPHEYRMHVYYRSARFRRFAHDVVAGGGRGYTLVKVTRDPAKRLVSMFRHACRFPFMTEIFREKLGIDIATAGLSLRDFATVLQDLPLVVPTAMDPHISAQYHPVWDWDFDRVITLNIDQIGLDDALNAVEAEFGMKEDGVRRACRVRGAAAVALRAAGAARDRRADRGPPFRTRQGPQLSEPAAPGLAADRPAGAERLCGRYRPHRPRRQCRGAVPGRAGAGGLSEVPGAAAVTFPTNRVGRHRWACVSAAGSGIHPEHIVPARQLDRWAGMAAK